jgi:hypothetical protein
VDRCNRGVPKTWYIVPGSVASDFEEVMDKVVILGIQRLSGGQAGNPIHYVQYKSDILDIFSKYS